MATNNLVLFYLMLLAIDHSDSQPSESPRNQPGPNTYYISRRAVDTESYCDMRKEIHDQLAYQTKACSLPLTESGRDWIGNTRCGKTKAKAFEFSYILRNLTIADYQGAHLFLPHNVAKVGIDMWSTQQAKQVTSSSCDQLRNGTVRLTELLYSRTSSGCLKIDISHIVEHFLRHPWHNRFQLVVKVEKRSHVTDDESVTPFLQVIRNDADSEDSEYCKDNEKAANKIRTTTTTPMVKTTRKLRRVRRTTTSPSSAPVQPRSQSII